jgi:hypothetical protein
VACRLELLTHGFGAGPDLLGDLAALLCSFTPLVGFGTLVLGGDASLLGRSSLDLR